MGLSGLSLASFYTKDDDILNDFYHPCISESILYNRVSGYFSSAIFDLAAVQFHDFFAAGGKMNLVCSPCLRSEDASAIISEKDSYMLDHELLLTTLKDPSARDSSQVLCYLIAAEMVEVQIAELENGELMHEKIGIFESNSEAVSFTGSINETRKGWSEQGNKESFDVFLSWSNERDDERVNNHKARFHKYWTDNVIGTSVRKPTKEFFSVVEENKAEGKKIFDAYLSQNKQKTFKYTPESYQKLVIDDWKNQSRRGIVKFCTGAGKTVVGLLAMKWAAEHGVPVLLVVPSKTLLYQWREEMEEVFENANLLLAGAGNNAWKDRGVVEGVLRQVNPDALSAVVVTTRTAVKDDFLARISKVPRALIIADEVHNLGARETSKLLGFECEYRMGLSATPERYGDDLGTQKLFDYFGPILCPVIDIPTAIAKKRLVPYEYDYEVGRLSDQEQEDWDNYTNKIGRLIASGSRMGDRETQSNNSLDMLIIQRARIAKKARSKLDLGLSILQKNFVAGQHWLFFLEDGDHLLEFKDLIKGQGYPCMVYDGETSMETRQLIIQNYEQRGGILLSMKCLDEGVDVPLISHAVIMASSQNPRQFVQRRGRVLRFAGEQKRRAYIWDVIAMPQLTAADSTRSLIVSEIARAIEFAEYAENPSVRTRLEATLADYGLSIEDCLLLESDDNLTDESAELEDE